VNVQTWHKIKCRQQPYCAETSKPREIDHSDVDYKYVFERSWDNDPVPRCSPSSEIPYIKVNLIISKQFIKNISLQLTEKQAGRELIDPLVILQGVP
jgi:hypothetical protein